MELTGKATLMNKEPPIILLFYERTFTSAIPFSSKTEIPRVRNGNELVSTVITGMCPVTCIWNHRKFVEIDGDTLPPPNERQPRLLIQSLLKKGSQSPSLTSCKTYLIAKKGQLWMRSDRRLPAYGIGDRLMWCEAPHGIGSEHILFHFLWLVLNWKKGERKRTIPAWRLKISGFGMQSRFANRWRGLSSVIWGLSTVHLNIPSKCICKALPLKHGDQLGSVWMHLSTRTKQTLAKV